MAHKATGNLKQEHHLISSKKNSEEIKMVKAINKSQDIRHPTHNLQNDRKLVYDTNSTQMKMTNPYIFLDKEINILKKDIKENYESEVKEKEDFNNKDNSISKKKVDFVDEREK